MAFVHIRCRCLLEVVFPVNISKFPPCGAPDPSHCIINTLRVLINFALRVIHCNQARRGKKEARQVLKVKFLELRRGKFGHWKIVFVSKSVRNLSEKKEVDQRDTFRAKEDEDDVSRS